MNFFSYSTGRIRKMIYMIFIFLLAHSYGEEEEGISCNEKTYSAVDCLGIPLDHKLVEKLNRRNGLFIEVGANNGVTQSNTKLLEEGYNWSGILIEPSACLFAQLSLNRPKSACFQCALGAFDQENTFVYGDFDGHLMASIDGERRHKPAQEKVIIRSLQSILDEVGYTHIHFFSLDTEGYELNILKGIDFNKTSFDYLLIEVYNRDFAAIIDFLLMHGYMLIENFSNYNLNNNPGWDGTHNDYLFQRKT